jgi:uncharacterized protein (DUF58 family)
VNADRAETMRRRVVDKLHRIEIQTRRLSTDALHGGVRSRLRGRGMDFDEVREYTPGDDVRAIDWNATARAGGRPFVKKFREERQLNVVFVVDMSASGDLGAGTSTKREQAVEIACLLALSAIRNDHRISLALFADHVELFVPPARGRAHALRIVRDLLTFEPAGRGTNLTGALRLVRERTRRRSVVIVLSDLLFGGATEAVRQELRALASRHDVVLVRTGDELDRTLPDVGLVTLEDAETGEVLEVDTGSREARARLTEAIRATNEGIRALAREAQADLLEVDTAQSYLGPLVAFFRMRGRGVRS